MEKIIRVGNIEFTPKSVSIVRDYSSEEEIDAYFKTTKSVNNEATTLHIAKCAIKERIEHCERELQKHLSEAILITSSQVIWDNGHFTMPVYQEMVEFIENDPHSWNEVSLSMLNQILRALYTVNYIPNCSIRDIQATFMAASELLTYAAIHH